jgi:hypothetical protein
MNPGLIGGVGGALIGMAGGTIGTWASIHNTRSRQERRFMVRYAIVIWTGITLFVTALLVLPRPYNLLLWIPYAVLLPLGIRVGNRRQTQIRAEDSKCG